MGRAGLGQGTHGSFAVAGTRSVLNHAPDLGQHVRDVRIKTPVRKVSVEAFDVGILGRLSELYELQADALVLSAGRCNTDAQHSILDKLHMNAV